MMMHRRSTSLLQGFLLLMAMSGFAFPGMAQAQTSPSAVVKAFYTACNDGEYSKAERLASKESLERMVASLGASGGLSTYCEGLTEQGTLTKIEVLSEKVRGEGARVEIKFHYKNGSTDDGHEVLIKKGGVWKIELLSQGGQ